MAVSEARRLVARAASRHRAGSRGEAERLYQAALALTPRDPDALHGLGCLAHEGGRPDLAIGLIGQAVGIAPEVAHYMISLGLALLDRNHLEEARAALQVAVLRDADDPRAHRGLAQALSRLGRLADAQASLRAAIRLDPKHPAAHLALGNLLRAEGDIAGAVAAFAEAARLAPSDALAWHSLAASHGQAGALEQAAAGFRRVASLLPKDAAAQANLGTALFTLGRLEAARDQLLRARTLAPGNPETQSSLGLVLVGLGETIQAEQLLARASRLAPASDAIAINHGTALAALERRSEAEALFRSVLARDSANPQARFNLATQQLARGALAEGWEGFEARLALLPPDPSPIAPWDGAALRSGRVLVRAEQGLGDTIQFLRWVPIAARRARLILDLPAPLHRLVRRMGFDPQRVRIAEADTDRHDCAARVSLLSLPHVLRHPDVPPLAAPVQRQAGGMPLRVGLAWAGSAAYQFDRLRSIRLAHLAPLAASGASFVSLQLGEAAMQAREPPAGMQLSASGPATDLAETADRIEALDLVISVDTAVAHLAGALGKPVWLLDRFGGDWRWGPGFDHGRAWYPSLRRFAPVVALDPADAWSGVIAEAAEALAALAKGYGISLRRDAPPPVRS